MKTHFRFSFRFYLLLIFVTGHLHGMEHVLCRSVEENGYPTFDQVALTGVVSWENSPERRWAGPDIWCNRLQDWKVQDGYLIADAGKEFPCRTAHLMTWQLEGPDSPFEIRTSVRLAGEPGEGSFAGLLVGAGEGRLDYRGAALIHHFPGKGGGILAVLETGGDPVVSFRDMSANTNKAEYPLLEGQQTTNTGNVTLSSEYLLTFRAVPSGKGTYTLTLTLSDINSGKLLKSAVITEIPAGKLKGNIALVSHNGGHPLIHKFRFVKVGGDRIVHHPDHFFGPVAGTLYSVSGHTLKLSAQFTHMGYETFLTVKDADKGTARGGSGRTRFTAILEKEASDGQWNRIDGPKAILGPHYNVLFRSDNWDKSRKANVRVTFKDYDGKVYHYPVVIKADPVEKPEIKVAAFACFGDIGRSPQQSWPQPGENEMIEKRWTPGNVWAPFEKTVDAVNKRDVDMLFFTGDQIYEFKPTPKDWTAEPNEDYLYKWYIWMMSVRELTDHIPAMVQPDDHDVYHGNLWGWSGRINTTGSNNDGGYMRSPAFVNMVHRTQTCHMPDAYDKTPALNNISNYYTHFTWGDVGFAVLEDRKFKTPPAVTNESEQELLGSAQIQMLREWGNDWKDQQFKVIVSQTVYASMSTDFDGNLRADTDSDGFPKVRRDEFLDIVRRYGAFIISGDQHLASFARLGIEEPSDAVYQFTVPAVGNIFWRWFYPTVPGKDRAPGAPGYTGEFIDGFGNYFRMIAAANPEREALLGDKLHQRYLVTTGEMEKGIGDEKRTCRGEGYGIVRFNKNTRQITAECWPDEATPEKGGRQFEGWPVSISWEDLDGRKPVAWLPQLRILGTNNAVIQIIDQKTGKMVKSTRIKGTAYSPGVFTTDGTYTVRVGIPERENSWKEITGLKPGTEKDSDVLKIKL